MKITLALFIFSITVYQPAIAAIGVTSDENIKPVPYDTRQEPAETQKNIISEDSRARNLYQNHCTSCHESIVFIRANRKAKNYEDLSYWVNQRAYWLI